MLFQGGPLRNAYHIAAEARIALVGVAQAIIARTPIVGQQYHTVHVVYFGLGIKDATRRRSIVENVIPLTIIPIRQRAPRVDGVATVAYRIVAPVGLTRLVV